MNKKSNAITCLALGIAGIILGIINLNKINSVAYIALGVGVFLVIIAFISLYLSFKPKADQKELPEYRRKKTVLSRAEYDFLQILKSLLPNDKYEIDIQVPLVAVIDKLTQNSYRNELFRVADFLVVDSVSFSPLLLIELNDASHKHADRIERDRKVNEICERAGMPLVTFMPDDIKDVGYIKKTIYKNMLKK